MARLTSLHIFTFFIFASIALSLPTPQGPQAAGGNAVSGTSGPANGGGSSRNGGLLNILSNNGGPGGISSGGDAEAGNSAPNVQDVAKGRSKIIKFDPADPAPGKYQPKGGHDDCPECVNGNANNGHIDNKVIHNGLLDIGILGL